MKTQTISLLACLLLLEACSDAPTTKPATSKTIPATSETAPTPPAPKEPEAAPPIVRLSGKFLREGDYGVPQNLVILEVDGKKRTIDTVATCETIPAADFDRYDIPKDAVTACGGWFAGGGDYFYAVVRHNKPVVYYGWQDEGQQDTGFHWKKME